MAHIRPMSELGYIEQLVELWTCGPESKFRQHCMQLRQPLAFKSKQIESSQEKFHPMLSQDQFHTFNFKNFKSKMAKSKIKIPN